MYYVFFKKLYLYYDMFLLKNYLEDKLELLYVNE